ncbi:unnamed protein product [Clonostachys byssicola]|uniref:STAS domain-containing protein n=1 Tax=Clonostachys byssicola TaxID=160290 RepID=A0A9N9U4H5_9HYPO|nr:unnamed protein product [Clonostachys byssicola]
MAGRPDHQRSSSYNGDYRPSQPSGLRQSHRVPSVSNQLAEGAASAQASESTPLIQGQIIEPSHRRPSIHPAHEGLCTHGTFSPRAESPTEAFFGNWDDEGPTPDPNNKNSDSDSSLPNFTPSDDWHRWLRRRIKTRKMGQSSELAQQAGIRDTPLMYLSYYIPFLTWIQQYNWSFLKGDLVSALTMASFYLPMALSYASNLAHVPPIHGLYAFVFNPFIYAVFGSCPQMVVGPEAAGSLLVGAAVKQNLSDGGEDDDVLHAQICGVITGLAGAMVLIAGLVRLGFLDSVLSRPFLRGFISAIGFVIAVDQLIPELGLSNLTAGTGVSHGSSVDKIRFIISHVDKTHMPTFAVAATSFVIIMVCREGKKYLQPRYPSVVFFPDRFIVVVVSAVLCWRYNWHDHGVEILGEIKTASGGLFAFQWPFQPALMDHIRAGMTNSFLIALLGFFESSVAAKSLGGSKTIQGMQLSANRELIALGVANFVGGCFSSIPAFGGYGRSKVNQQTGGKSPMSSVFLSIITLFCILFLLPYFYYLPKPVLSAMISVVAFSLVEEAPHDIAFFVRIRGWAELGLMAMIFLATIFYSLTFGMALGVGVSLLMVIRHSTRPRIQILGRIPGTNRFENAESANANVEFVEGSLIVKIPEPLTFANTGELKARLRRLEMYGTSSVHPALPALRNTEANRNIIFDIHGVTSIDGSGTQVLTEIVSDYRARGVRVFFSRGPTPGGNSPVWRLMENSGIVEMCGGPSHFVNDVEEALRRTEYEESILTTE